MPTMLPVRFDVVAGKRVRYFRSGEGEGPPIVFLHGYPDNLQMWSAVAPLLAGFEVIAFDWPGMGASEVWSGGATPFHNADRLLALLDHWRISRTALVGIDMGGQPALVAAAQHPDRVSHLILSGSLLQWDAPTSFDIALLRRFRLNQLFLKRFPHAVFRRAVSSSVPQIDHDVRSDFWEHFRRPLVRDFIVRMCAGYQGTLSKLPRHVAMAVLCLWGGRDRHFPPLHAQWVHGASVEIVADGWHWLPLQMPREFAAAVQEFVSPGSPGAAAPSARR